MKLEDFMDEFSVLECKDNYGSDMVESSLADWLELAALRAVRTPWGNIVGSWRDVGLPEARRSEIIYEGEYEAEELELYNLALNEVKERDGYLGDAYPFEIDRWDCVALKQDFDIRSSTYIDLLILSLLKGFANCGDNEVLKPISSYFELLVSECLQMGFEDANCAGLFKSAVMGTAVQGSFNDRLSRVSAELGIAVNPAAVPRSPKQKDDGVDIVCGIVWGDGAKSDPLCAIQATCCKSANWGTKLYNVHASKWSLYLNEYTIPLAVIAVPYQLTKRAVRRVFDEHGHKSYLDRTRLVKIADGSSVVGRSTLVPLRSAVAAICSSKLSIDIAH